MNQAVNQIIVQKTPKTQQNEPTNQTKPRNQHHQESSPRPVHHGAWLVGTGRGRVFPLPVLLA